MALKGFRKGLGNNSTYVCANCKHLTRNVGGDEAGCTLCERCYDEAGIENAHSDGHHDAEKDMTCHNCNPALKTVIEQRAEEAAAKLAKQAVSPAAKSLSGKETPMASNVKAEVAKLVRKLVALKDKSDAEGRKIRRILRKLGHHGGTGAKLGRPAAAKKAKPAPKKAKKASARKAKSAGGPPILPPMHGPIDPS